jgi:hypothetical protein
MSKTTASKIEAHAALVKAISEPIAVAHAAAPSAAEVLAALARGRRLLTMPEASGNKRRSNGTMGSRGDVRPSSKKTPVSTRMNACMDSGFSPQECSARS